MMNAPVRAHHSSGVGRTLRVVQIDVDCVLLVGHYVAQGTGCVAAQAVDYEVGRDVLREGLWVGYQTPRHQNSACETSEFGSEEDIRNKFPLCHRTCSLLRRLTFLKNHTHKICSPRATRGQITSLPTRITDKTVGKATRKLYSKWLVGQHIILLLIHGTLSQSTH